MSSDDLKLRIPFSERLHELDTAEQTFGCRHSNPDICGSNSISGICSFTRSDHLCLKPSKAWPKQYLKLKEATTDESI